MGRPDMGRAELGKDELSGIRSKIKEMLSDP
jgi:hypothetical protein